jgi:hypothetical protein
MINQQEKIIKPPNLSIANVSFHCSNFAWVFKPGAYPYDLNIRMDAQSAYDIFTRSANKPTEIKFEYDELTENWKGSIKNVFILQRYDDGVYLNTLKISDPRYLWVNRVVVGRFNWRYQINAFKVANDLSQDVDRQGGVAGEDNLGIGKPGGGDSSSVFGDRFVISRFAILPPTRNKSDNKWTAKELLEMICSELLGQYWGGFYSAKTDKTNWAGLEVSPENILFDAVYAPEAVNYLLRISRSQMNYFPDGKIYIFEENDDDIEHRFAKAGLGAIKEGVPGKWTEYVDLDDRFIFKKYGVRERPSIINVLFDKEIETPFEYKSLVSATGLESSNTSILDTAVTFLHETKAKLNKEMGIKKVKKSANEPVNIDSGKAGPKDVVFTGSKKGGEDMFETGSLINVGRWPFVKEAKADGKRYYTGQWVHIDILLEEIGMDREFILDHWYRDVWRTEAFVRIAQGIFQEWQNLGIIKDWTGAVDPRFLMQYDRVSNALVTEIQNSFLKTYQIHPAYREKLVSWTTHRAALADRVSGFRVWAPVFLNYCTMPTIYQFLGAGDEPPEPTQINKDIYDKDIKDILNLSLCPFSIEILDQGLGVFRIQEVGDFHNVYYGFEIGTFDEEKGLPPTTPEVDYLNWFLVPKKKEIRFVTLLNIKYAIPNDRRLMYEIKVKPYNQGLGPPHDIYCRREPARFVWRSNFDKPSDILTSKPINDGILNIFAQSEVNIKEFELQDWKIGTLKLVGLHNVEPFGNAVITWHFESGMCSTIIDMMHPPKAPELYSALPRASRQFLWGELGDWYNKL